MSGRRETGRNIVIGKQPFELIAIAVK